MTPAARYAAAIDVLDRWLDEDPIERALTGWARGARYAGSQDRAAIRDHVYDVLRLKGSCAVAGGGETGRALILGLLRQTGGPIDQVFSGVGHAPQPLDEDERAVVDGTLSQGLDVLNLPDWVHQKYVQGKSNDYAAILKSQTDRAPLYLRLNGRKATLDQAIAALAEEGVEAEADPACATALIVTANPRKLRLSNAYLDGLVEIQDLSVQAACAQIDWPGSGKILDYCAGGGGKSLAIAARTEATIFAHDANPARMKDLPARAERAGVWVRQLSTDALKSEADFALVLCDVPCTGSGTWRRDPEAKWRLTPDDLAALCQAQADILDQAATLVAPGGRLVYMTCSAFQDENEDQIAEFLLRAPDWQITRTQTFGPPVWSDGFFVCELTHSD
jgi:16S rRNA (cytosine967-C5)-methyltransferase